MKKQVQDSLDKIKYLMEFHFKENSRADSVDVPHNGEQPVSFKEVGDTYKKEPEHDYPSFDVYRDEVIMQEDDIDGNGEEQPSAPPGEQAAPAAPQQPAVDNAQPAPAPADPQPQAPPIPPAPAPVEPVAPPVPSAPEDVNIHDDDHMFMKMEDQMAKTDEMLARFDLIQQQLSAVHDVNSKLSDVEKKLDDLVDPPYGEQLEMISKNAYPYNVKLSDFWGWEKDNDQEPTEQEFKITPEDVNSYNKEEIKNSFS